MSKIYSRPRLKIPRLIFYNNRNARKNKKKISLIIVVIVAFTTLKIILDAVNPIYDTLCESKAISLVTVISNNKVAEVMKTHTYDELFSIEKDENGKINMIKANVMSVNEITSDIAVKIQEEIDKQGRENIEIALRKFYRN